MVELKHPAHDCVLTSPELSVDGICNICFKDKRVEFACDRCNYDLCKSCSHIPQKVSHTFHPEHPLELCTTTEFQKQKATKHMLCSGCGNLFVASLYYECKVCKIFLELGCALPTNIKTSWDAKETLHYSHVHMLQRCRPGLDARGSCLMCELPLTPFAICFGCIQCYSFVHERCLDLPKEIHHPVHPAHPLKRLDFKHSCGYGKKCDACKLHIKGSPLGCSECNFSLHLRCADSLLRGLMHKDHRHKLFYIAGNVESLDIKNVCGVCKHREGFYREPHYQCVECGWRVHLKCLKLPELVIKKSYHIHPLEIKKFIPEDKDSLEYCGVCETAVHRNHHAYCCKECDFVGHIECILNEEVSSPLYLKDLFTRDESIRRLNDKDVECETKNPEHKIVLDDIKHNHVLRNTRLLMSDRCHICREYTNPHDSVPWKCESCDFEAHDSCVKLRQPSLYRFHLKHQLTLLPSYPAGNEMSCDICKKGILAFNLFCRECNFIICASCAIRDIKSFGGLQRGQKFIRYEEEKCVSGEHNVAQVMVSSSYQVACTICDERLYGNIWSCMECEEIYHSLCIQDRKKVIFGHPHHYDHELRLKQTSGSKCNACKLDITTNYCYFCSICSLGFHIKCIEAVDILVDIKCCKHYLYNFWRNNSLSAQACMICKRPCGASFYGCNSCNFKVAHPKCIGFPTYVKNQRHKHTVKLEWSFGDEKYCSLCGKEIDVKSCGYKCYHCDKHFHPNCIMYKVERQATTEEDQISDIYLMYIELDLFDLMANRLVTSESAVDSDSSEYSVSS